MDKIKYILFSEYTQLVLQSKKSDFICFCIDVSMNCASMKCPSIECPSMKYGYLGKVRKCQQPQTNIF